MNGPGGSEGGTLAVRPPARAGLGRTFFLSPFLTEGPDVCFLSPSPGRSTRYQSTVKALRSPAEKDVRFALPPPSVLRFLDGGFFIPDPCPQDPPGEASMGARVNRLVHLLLLESEFKSHGRRVFSERLFNFPLEKESPGSESSGI